MPVGTVTSTALTRNGDQGDDEHRPRHQGARRRPVVGPDRQRPGRAGRQPGARPRWTGARPARAAPTCRPRPNQVPADVGAVVASATRLLQAIPAGDLNKLIGELATVAGRAGGQPAHARQRRARPSRRSSSPTSSSSPSCWPMRRPALERGDRGRARSCARTWPTRRRCVQVLAQQKTGLAHPASRSGASAFDARWTTSSRRSRPTSAASCTTRPTSSPTSPSPPT